MVRNLLSNGRFWLVVKILLTGLFAYYLYQRLSDFNWEALDVFKKFEYQARRKWVLWIPALIVLNWTSDTFLWWQIVRSKVKVTFISAFKINLMSQAVGMTTPANLGEYGVKALHFTELGKARQSFLLTVSYATAKTYAKFIAGLIAGMYIWQDNRTLWTVCLILLLGLSISYFFIPHLLEFIYHSKLGRLIFGKEDKTWHFKNRSFFKSFFPSIIKFSSYTAQLAILICFNSNLSFADAFWRSAATYSLSSFIPTFSFFDPIIKTSIGDLVMTPAGVSLEWLAVSIGLVWILNMGLPSLLGFGLWLGSKTKNRK